MNQGMHDSKQDCFLSIISKASQRITLDEAEVQARRHARSLGLMRIHRLQESDYLCFAHTRHRAELRDPGPACFRVLQAVMVFFGNPQSGFLMQLLAHTDSRPDSVFWRGYDNKGPFNLRLDHFLERLPESLCARLFTLDHKDQDRGRARQRMATAIRFAQASSTKKALPMAAGSDYEGAVANYLKRLGSTLTAPPNNMQEDDMQEGVRLERLAHASSHLPTSLRALYASRLVQATEATFIDIIPKNTEAHSLAHEALDQLRQLLDTIKEVACDSER